MILRKLVPFVLVAALIAALPGCKGESKPDAATGPRVTGGAVDTEARPHRPGLGGAAKPE